MLVKVASIFKKYECEKLMAARYGGEEFLIYQQAATTQQAIEIVEQIQNEIRTTMFHTDDENTIHVTVSIGMAKIEEGSLLYDVINQADKNLYLAKGKNRDQLVVSAEI